MTFSIPNNHSPVYWWVFVIWVTSIIIWGGLTPTDSNFPTKVHVYNPDEIIDASAGKVEAFISPGNEALIKLQATVIKSDENMRRYSVEKVS